jgi:hypothetical protein
VRHRIGIATLAVVLVGTVAQAGSARQAFNPGGLHFTAVEGIRFSGTVANFTDPSAPKSTYKATIDWGDGSPIDNGTLVKTGVDNAHDVTGQHTYAEEGTYELKVHITGGSGGGDCSPVATVVDAPLTATVAVPAVSEGGTVNGQIGTFADQDTGDNANEYGITINWGDGSSSPGAATKTGPGAFAVSGSHTYGDEGARTVSLTVNDKGGSTVTQSQAITVADAPLAAGAPLTRRGTEGKPLAAGSIGTFTDGFAGATVADYSGATISWGDGSTSAGTITAAPAGGFQVGGAHTYREEGRYAISAVVTDRGGSTVTLHGSAVIADAPLHATGKRLSATAGRRFHGAVASFTDGAGRFARATDFRVTITWGDGHSSPGTVSGSAGRFTVTGTHAYTTAGPKRVTVVIRDRGGAVATARSTFSVSS